MASLQARHSRQCKLARPWTTFEGAASGCTCKPGPMYHIVTRADAKLIREAVGHNRQIAERALRKVQVEIDEGIFEAPRNVRFDQWADEWLQQLRRRSTTHAGYTVTMEYAKQAFGKKPVRKLRSSDVQAMLAKVEESNKARKRNVSPTTLAKHLRQLGACLQAAEVEGLVARNPVRLLHKTSKPKPVKKRPSYFTDSELSRLWPELSDRPVHLAVCKLAVTTGMRFGEIAALKWTDVHLLEGEIRIRAQFTAGQETTTKDNDPRTVDLTPQARTLLEGWLTSSGGDGLVFERETGGHLDNEETRDLLYAAMKRAGVPRVGEAGGSRTFHGFRNTFARIALENAAELTWVQKQLGHSSITLTRDTYGHWSREAEKLAAGD